MPLGYLNFKKKLFLETMQFIQKQFPVNWLTSGRLAFVIPCARKRGREWRPKWRDDEKL